MHTLRKRIRATVLAFAIATGALLGTASTANASMDPSGTLALPGQQWTIRGHSDFSFRTCGVKQCAAIYNLDWSVKPRTLGPYTSNLVRGKATVGFSGAGLEVGVAIPLGVSAAFTDIGSACSQGWWEGSATSVSMDWGTGTVCSSSTLLTHTNATTTITGAVRVGSSYTGSAASDNQY
jgi:hypothetical protein